MWKGLLLSLLYRWGNWGGEKLFAEFNQWWSQFSNSGHHAVEPHSKSLCHPTLHSTWYISQQIGRYRLAITSKELGRGFDIWNSLVLLSSALTSASTQRAVKKKKRHLWSERMSHYFQVNKSLLKLKAFSKNKQTPTENTFISLLKRVYA